MGKTMYLFINALKERLQRFGMVQKCHRQIADSHITVLSCCAEPALRGHNRMGMNMCIRGNP